jgi:hypothetical protein
MIKADVDTIPFALPTRLKRIIRKPTSWQVWTETNDFILGTYFTLWDNGCILRVTVREDQGDEVMEVRPSTAEICKEIV